jgi:hypothetical protein
MRLRTVLACAFDERGNTSLRNAATVRNGISAASFAVRNRSAGAMGDWRVNSPGTVCGPSGRHRQA